MPYVITTHSDRECSVHRAETWDEAVSVFGQAQERNIRTVGGKSVRLMEVSGAQFDALKDRSHGQFFGGRLVSEIVS